MLGQTTDRESVNTSIPQNAETGLHWLHLRSKKVLHLLGRYRLVTVGGLIILLFGIAAVFAPLLTPYDPYEQDITRRLESPSLQHPAGLDQFGRDLLTRIIFGARISMIIGLGVVGGALLMGGSLGSVAGYYGGKMERAVVALVDVLLAFPELLLAIAMVAALGPNLVNLMIAVAIRETPIFIRLTRGLVLALKRREFVLAAKATGVRDRRIIVRHILPNITAEVMVYSSLRVATVILTAASLSFLGLGVQPPLAEWGSMLSDTRKYLRSSPHVVVLPGIAIVIAILGFNLLGDGLRDLLDPTLRSE